MQACIMVHAKAMIAKNSKRSDRVMANEAGVGAERQGRANDGVLRRCESTADYEKPSGG